MLKKTERLDRKSFSIYFSKGKKTHGLYSTIIYAQSEGFFSSVVVGKKVSKKAPVRNTIRRRVYGIIEKLKKEHNLTGVYIVIIKPEVIKLSKRQFLEAVEAEVGRVLN